jgi:hypothetical protein
MDTTERVSAVDRLRFSDATMTKEAWFADHGKIGAGDSGIGEMDSPADAEGIVAWRNAMPEIIELLRELEVSLPILEDIGMAHRMSLNLEGPPAAAIRLRASLAALESKVAK